MKKILFAVMCVVLAATMCACGAQESAGAKTLESVVPAGDWEQAQTAMDEGLVAQGLAEILSVKLAVSGNTLTFDYRFLQDEMTQDEFDADYLAGFEAVLDSDTATMEYAIEGMTNTKGLGVITMTMNVYDADDTLLYTANRETKEY